MLKLHRRWVAFPRTAWVLIGAVAGCGSGGQPEDAPILLSATATDGTEGGATSGQEDEGVDETGGEPVETNRCLTEPAPGRFGYKYQCEGDIAIDLLVEGEFDGSPVSDSLTLEFGHGVPGDSYAHPHVMACCPEYDLSAPNCEQGHEQACMADLAEQGCKSIEPNLRDFADDEFGGPGLADTVKRTAIHKIADHVRDHQGDCIAEFITNTGIGPTPPTCDEDDNGVEYDSLLQSGVWSFDPAGVVTNVEISVRSANWTDLHPLDGSAETCESSGDNDGVLFLERDPSDPGSKLSLLTAGTVALYGPSLDGARVEGFGVLSALATGCQAGRCSTLRVTVDPARSMASLDELDLYAAGAVEVGTAEQAVVVDDFRAVLWDSTSALLDDGGSTLTVPTGHARFAVSAEVDGMRGVITATNASAIVLSRIDQEWSSSAFELSHRDALGQEWVLVLTPVRWQ